MSDEWGPWIEHDGKGCPCVGQYVHAVFGDGQDLCAIAGSRGGQSWDWRNSGWNPVIRYRIRKPRGLTILEGILENLPETVDA